MEQVLPTALMLFLVMDSLGNVPLFLSLLKDLPAARRRVVLARELLIALGVLLAFLYGGQSLLALLKLEQESVSIAGGIVLFLIGLRMIFPTAEGVFGDIEGGEPLIVPMAIPCIAGPSTIAVLLLLAQQDPTRINQWALALLIAWAAGGVVLFSATALYRFLGKRALGALEKLMGMILVALSVQMLLDGIRSFLQSTHG